jgi:hypothetical protein
MIKSVWQFIFSHFNSKLKAMMLRLKIRESLSKNWKSKTSAGSKNSIIEIELFQIEKLNYSLLKMT